MDPRITALLERQGRELVPFADTLALIEAVFDYTPTAFSNGVGEDRLDNPAGINEGSCKVFAFGQWLGLSVDQTLACFGEHYQAVCKDPDGQAHPNIRLFMRHGWAGIRFEGEPLRFRQS